MLKAIFPNNLRFKNVTDWIMHVGTCKKYFLVKLSLMSYLMFPVVWGEH